MAAKVRNNAHILLDCCHFVNDGHDSCLSINAPLFIPLSTTNEAAEELESSFMKILEKHKLSEKEVLYTLARVADSFIRMHEDFCFDEKNTLDAEAAFNDYFIACRDISNEDDGSITDSKGYSSEKGN